MEKRPRALVIDDEPTWVKQLADLLKETGYLVSKAENREQAEYYLNTYAFDVAIVDVNLTDALVDESGEPLDQQGMELVEGIRRFARKKDMGIVIVTGYGTPRITREAFKSLSVNDVLFKQNFNIEDFRLAVHEATANSYLRESGAGVESV